MYNMNDGDTESAQAECLKHCHARSDATGCEVIWGQQNNGCYVHTRIIAKGNRLDNYYCWVFTLGKCIRMEYTLEYTVTSLNDIVYV